MTNQENAVGIGKEKTIKVRERAVLGEIGNVQTRTTVNNVNKDASVKKKEIAKSSTTTTTLKQT